MEDVTKNQIPRTHQLSTARRDGRRGTEAAEREVFEHCTRAHSEKGERATASLKVLFIVLGGEPLRFDPRPLTLKNGKLLSCQFPV
jgi:hypothetical protein